jgi:hypothetical protein
LDHFLWEPADRHRVRQIDWARWNQTGMNRFTRFIVDQ